MPNKEMRCPHKAKVSNYAECMAELKKGTHEDTQR